MEWLIGDVVYHKHRSEADLGFSGVVCGYCPGPEWIKVETPDGRKRIWLREHVHNVDAEFRAYGQS